MSIQCVRTECREKEREKERERELLSGWHIRRLGQAASRLMRPFTSSNAVHHSDRSESAAWIPLQSLNVWNSTAPVLQFQQTCTKTFSTPVKRSLSFGESGHQMFLNLRIRWSNRSEVLNKKLWIRAYTPISWVSWTSAEIGRRMEL